MARAMLRCHPQSANTAVLRIEASVARPRAGMLAVSYVLEGDLERLSIPPWTGSAIGARLWEHTCFELFIRKRDADAYDEFNFSPSGAWAGHRFERYRVGAPLIAPLPVPKIAMRRDEETLALEASIEAERLSPAYAEGPVDFGLSAVIEDLQGGLTYWALAHPPGKPDFHHAEAFAICLSARSRE